MADERSSKLAIKVVPGASRDGIAGWIGERLKVRVAAPPERGKANAAVERVIAAALGLPAERVQIVAGGSSPRKLVVIEGLSESAVHELLSKPHAEGAEAADRGGATSKGPK